MAANFDRSSLRWKLSWMFALTALATVVTFGVFAYLSGRRSALDASYARLRSALTQINTITELGAIAEFDRLQKVALEPAIVGELDHAPGIIVGGSHDRAGATERADSRLGRCGAGDRGWRYARVGPRRCRRRDAPGPIERGPRTRRRPHVRASRSNVFPDQHCRRPGEPAHRQHPGNRSAVAPARLLDELLMNVPMPTTVEVRRRYKHTLPGLMLDRDQVGQIVWNLVTNAVQAMAGRGSITVDADVVSGLLRISVQDSGPGVPATDIERIFEPMYTTKPDGVGLGLSICRKLARASGGDLLLTSAGTPGACFVLELPAILAE